MISPRFPRITGPYEAAVDLGARGRQAVTSFVRTFAVDPVRVQYPHFCLDALPSDLLKRLGVHVVRMDVGDPTNSPQWPEYHDRIDKMLQAYNDANIDVLFMNGGAPFYGPWQPMGRFRTPLDEKDNQTGQSFDLAWAAFLRRRFPKVCAYLFATEYGWPKGSSSTVPSVERAVGGRIDRGVDGRHAALSRKCTRAWPPR